VITQLFACHEATSGYEATCLEASVNFATYHTPNTARIASHRIASHRIASASTREFSAFVLVYLSDRSAITESSFYLKDVGERLGRIGHVESRPAICLL